MIVAAREWLLLPLLIPLVFPLFLILSLALTNFPPLDRFLLSLARQPRQENGMRRVASFLLLRKVCFLFSRAGGAFSKQLRRTFHVYFPRLSDLVLFVVLLLGSEDFCFDFYDFVRIRTLGKKNK